jgi:hypothetical protein
MSKSMKALVLAGVLSLAAASAVQAGGNPTGHGGEWHTGRSHASAAPVCGDQCPVLATEGGPGGAGDNNGRSSAALSKGGGEFLVAGGRVGGCGDISR